MERTLKHEILEFHPDTLRAVREACGLAAPGRMDEAVALLQDWISKQDHFLKKDFPRSYLETTLITSKGSIEKSKKRIDVICTMRTFAPQFFSKFDAKKDFTSLHDECKTLLLPKLTDDHYRVGMIKLCGNYFASIYQEMFQYITLLCEYEKVHDYCNGFIFILDARDINPMDFITRLNMTEVRNIVTLVTKGYGARIKSIHFLTPSTAVQILIAMLKQVLSDKITSRFHVHKTPEELFEHVPKHILPGDLGGEEKSIETLYDEWLDVCSSEEYTSYMREMRDARTDEARRREELEDVLFGLPGTFRALSVD